MPAPPTPAGVEPLEVELVPVGPGAPPLPTAPVFKRRRRGVSDRLNLTRRDWILLGGGAGGVIGAVLIGALLARLLGRRDPEEDLTPEPTQRATPPPTTTAAEMMPPP
jgi:hypothetical protein